MSNSISAKAIESQILEDINACNTLLEILDLEQDALTNRDANALADVIERKTKPLAQLEASANQRALWAQEVPGDQPDEKWNVLLDNISHDKIQQNWITLKALTKECQQKNETNGKILARQQQVYSRLIELMRGQTATPNLYNATGSKTGSNRSFKLDEV